MKQKRHLFRLRKSAKILLRLSFILPWMQQTFTFLIRDSRARPKYSTHAHVLRRWWQNVTTRFIRQSGTLRRMVFIYSSISQIQPCFTHLKKTRFFSCLCCLRNATRLLNLSSDLQIWQNMTKLLTPFYIWISVGQMRHIQQTHSVVIGESEGCFLDGRGSHTLLLDGDADWIPESSSHQLLQFLCLSGWKQAGPSLLGQMAQDGVQAGCTDMDTRSVWQTHQITQYKDSEASFSPGFKAHIKEPISFIKNQHFQTLHWTGQVQAVCFPLEHILQASWSRNYNVGSETHESEWKHCYLCCVTEYSGEDLCVFIVSSWGVLIKSERPLLMKCIHLKSIFLHPGAL